MSDTSPPLLERIPHRPPFLFVNEIVETSDSRIVTRTQVRPEADFFRGHYPGNPIMPGVLLCECCFQSGAALLLNRTTGADGSIKAQSPGPSPLPLSLEGRGVGPTRLDGWRGVEPTRLDERREVEPTCLDERRGVGPTRHGEKGSDEAPHRVVTPVLTRIGDARFKRLVRPGETLTTEVILDDAVDNAYSMTARMTSEGQQVLRVTFTCMLVADGAHES